MFKLLFNLFKQQIKITKNITEHYHIDYDEGHGIFSINVQYIFL